MVMFESLALLTFFDNVPLTLPLPPPPPLLLLLLLFLRCLYVNGVKVCSILRKAPCSCAARRLYSSSRP